MKSFSKFILEVVTQASDQAKKMGLQSDGHGDYYDKRGKLVAKTVNGKLKFFGATRPPTPDERGAMAAQQQADAEAKEKAEREEVRKREGDPADLTVAFGRFNPPTVGHEKLLNRVKSAAGKGEYLIYPSRSNDPKEESSGSQDQDLLHASHVPWPCREHR